MNPSGNVKSLRHNVMVKCPHCDKTAHAGAIATHVKFVHTDSGANSFWARVDKNAPNGCWVWGGYCQRFGHGWLGRRGLAHRYAWELTVGPLPKDKCLLHHCDNPPCVNPAHLYVGDRLANGLDAAKRGRTTRGERNWSVKLKPEQVLEIRGLRGKLSMTEIARRYGVAQTTVSNIINRNIWKHLP